MGFNLKKLKGRLLGFVAGIILFSLLAEKSRQLVGEDASSKSGQFTWINCFDMGSGSLACLAKEGVKFYVYNVRAGHVERVRQRAYDVAYSNALNEDLNVKTAVKQAEKAGAKAAKVATRQASRITGPVMAGGWDFFEALYYGGTLMEGTARGLGTLTGTYVGGLEGEKQLGRIGFLIGSHLGSWFGGRVGLMAYDIIDGIRFLMSEYLVTAEVIEDASAEHSENAYSYSDL
eukprot:c19203_g1_i1 orf=85-780(+)